MIAGFAEFKPDQAADDLCVQALTTFVDAYGAEAGNMALKTLPYGGMYIAGGIAPKVWRHRLMHCRPLHAVQRLTVLDLECRFCL